MNSTTDDNKKLEDFLSNFKIGDIIWVENENSIIKNAFPFYKV